MKFLQYFSDEAVPDGTGAQTDSVVTAGTADEEFEELIKGKYSDAFKKRVQGIIDNRFKKMKSYESTIKAYAPLTESLQRDFPEIEKSDTEGLIKAYLEKVQSQGAEKTENTVSPGFIEALERKLKEQSAERVKTGLLADAESLRGIYPSFDLQRELSSSPEMKKLLLSGVPLRRAFEVINLEKIMGSALRFTAMKAGLDTAQALKANIRVQENSLSDRASSVRHTDVNNLTEKEIMKIISDVSNGAKITF